MYTSLTDTLLTLYRGDSSKIDQFQVSKTHKYCLVGQGIYLTTDPTVADSYRTKGADLGYRIYHIPLALRERVVTLCSKAADSNTRDSAFLAAYTEWLRCMGYAERYAGKKAENSAKYQKGLERIKKERWAEYEAHRESGRVRLEYVGAGQYRHIVVTLHNTGKLAVGYTSRFEVPRAVLEANTINVTRSIHDPSFWGLMWDNKIDVGVQQKQFDDPNVERQAFIHANTGRTYHLGGHYLPLGKHLTNIPHRDWARMRHVLLPYGVLGLEYEGGAMTCGKRHRAFCIWDEEWVNKHKVERYR